MHTIPLVLMLLKEPREAQDVPSLFKDHLMLAITNLGFIATLLVVLLILPIS